MSQHDRQRERKRATILKKALRALFNAPWNFLLLLDADAKKFVNPPRNFVGMCRCGDRLVNDFEKGRGECCHCATRWMV